MSLFTGAVTALCGLSAFGWSACDTAGDLLVDTMRAPKFTCMLSAFEIVAECEHGDVVQYE